MQYTLAVHVIEFETLHLCAVDERGMRRGDFLFGAPYRAGLRGVEFAEPLLHDARPFEVGAVERAAERIEHQQLDAREHIGRDVLVTQRGNEFGNAAGVLVVA